MKRKALYSLFVFFLFFLFLLTLVSCGTNSQTDLNIPSSTSSQINTNIPSSTSDISNTTEENDKKYKIFLLAKQSGFEGTYEEWLDSIKGDFVQMRVSNTDLEWKYSKDTNWTKLITLTDLVVQKEAKEIEISTSTTHIVWRYKDENEWNNLIELSSLVGNDGKSAYDIAKEVGFTGTAEEWVESLKGSNGLSAYEIFLKYYPEYLGDEKQWITDVALGNKCNLFGHEWNNGTITKEAKVGINGEKTFTCSICSSIKKEIIPMIVPAELEIYEIDGIKYLNYGTYPQTHVGDIDIINKLDDINDINIRGYYELDGKEYAKIIANPKKTGTYLDNFGNAQYYAYSDGCQMISNKSEYFLVEPIKWRILKDNKVLSNIVIDVTKFNESSFDFLDSDGETVIHPNSYEHSTVRSFINQTFYNIAFSDDQKKSIIGNGDKVCLLSSADCVNSDYGFSTNKKVFSVATDYAYAKGLAYSTEFDYFKNCYYWTSTPISTPRGNIYVNCVEDKWVCASLCEVFNFYGVRPCISLQMDNE